MTPAGTGGHTYVRYRVVRDADPSFRSRWWVNGGGEVRGPYTYDEAQAECDRLVFPERFAWQTDNQGDK